MQSRQIVKNNTTVKKIDSSYRIEYAQYLYTFEFAQYFVLSLLFSCNDKRFHYKIETNVQIVLFSSFKTKKKCLHLY